MQEIESMWIEVINTHQKPILLGYVYRPPNSNADRVTKFETMMIKVDTEEKETIIMGDFNIDIMSSKKHAKWSYIKNIFNMSQMVTESTRVTKTSSTLIDHVYCNLPENINYIAVPKYSISDHYSVCISHKRGFKTKKQIHDYITYRSTKYFNETDFIHDLSQCPFDSILEIDDPDEALLSFINIFTEVLNHHAPLIKKRVKHVYQNQWINDEIKEGMKKRDYYHKKKDT
ncbi:Hypothetical predicted protein [Mytilus galloprovincialis]|uniref:Endonuclease/exonuclease/phosphatase domain-containing protein n=1 Tax=Mytilus galloprovincialis TaxID=29158 RepID=A0A8B6BWV8_MYTGA|nr:Hypothetical predicted protein [Mytilus galloprovincialis]